MTPEQKKFWDENIEAICQDLRVRAMMPPKMLHDMRIVYDGKPANTAAQRDWAQMKKNNKEDFMERLDRAEHRYRIALKGLEEKWGKDAKGYDDADMGGDRILKLLDEISKRNKE